MIRKKPAPGLDPGVESGFPKDHAPLKSSSLPADRDCQRIGKWIWHARLVRTRSAAAELAGSGFVRVNGARVRGPGRMVRVGDIITVALEGAVRVLKLKGFSDRRGDAAAGLSLYDEIS
jgi:ribosome-associated heat shock protein Hsp15